ncbi:MAG TPA: hypothetical protein VG318_00175 [Actinomycetota bacterium]|nr:hypothetical protein [Actinomycetota bacterium]
MAALIGFLVIAGLAPSVSATPPAEPGEQGRIIRRDDMGVMVPPAGVTATLELVMPHGGNRVLTVEHRRDGSVHTRYEGPDAETSTDPHDQSAEQLVTDTATTLSACSTEAYRFIPNLRVANDMWWLFNDDVMANGVTAAQVKGSLINAGANITNADNDCGMLDNIQAPIVSGTSDTSLRTNFYIRSDGYHDCGQMDTYNVFEFGQLKDALASMCMWTWDNGDLLSADIRFGQGRNWFTTATPPCSNSTTGTKYWDFEGIATHELGHVYGMQHNVADSATREEKLYHSRATMNAMARYDEARCNTGYRTLGKGDILGLEVLY